MSATVSLNCISHTFKGHSEPVLSQIEGLIHAGERVAIVGRSGCGKTTLLQMMAGLLLPSDGTVRINSYQVIKPDARWNLMFQKSCLYPWLNVAENVRLGSIFAGQTEGLDERVEEYLQMVGLGDKRDAPVQSLSGGQQQRVALARSLCLKPELVLLDEPFSALDTFTRASLQDEVAELIGHHGLTMVLITHDIDEAVAMADRVLVMAESPGRFVGDEAVPMAYPRQRRSSEFATVRHRIMQRFEQASGMEPSAGGVTAATRALETTNTAASNQAV